MCSKHRDIYIMKDKKNHLYPKTYKNDIMYSPIGFIARLKDMIDQLNIQLDICDDDEYKMQFKMIRHNLKEFTEYYDYVTFDDNERLK